MKVPYRLVIEEQEYSKYAGEVDKSRLLVLDKSYQDRYDTCDDLGSTKSKGPGAARNFVWDHSISEGHSWHWVMDDNIRYFARYHANMKIPVKDGTVFKCMEDFCDRYDNVSMAGPNYCMFITRKSDKYPPFILNTRIYSCNLIRNDVPFRWRGRYNEDTDLSLCMLKAGWCTVQFNAFLQYKMPTQALKGGNTADFYAKEGTMPKSKMQVDLHPDISRIAFRFGRWHHYVNYSGFKKNKLRRKQGIDVKEGADNYGMSLLYEPNNTNSTDG
jgi:hypothetical protein